MKVIIPLAGMGTRLRPHTFTKPKPLVNVAGKPVLGHILDKLVGLPIEEIVFITGYLGDQIERYVSANYGFTARYIEQKELKGQAHAIRLAQPHVTGPVLIIFVDTIFEADLTHLDRPQSDGVIFVKEVEDPRRFGVVTLKDGYIEQFVEKPRRPVSNLAVAGVYYLREARDLFIAIDRLIERNLQTRGEYFLADALEIMIQQGARLEAETMPVWEDCGTAESILHTNRYLLQNGPAQEVPTENSIIRSPVYIAASAIVRNSIVGPYVHVGEGVQVTGAIVGPYVSLAAGSQVTNAIVLDSIINEEAQIEEATLSGSLVGSHAHVRGTYSRLNVGDASEVDLGLRPTETANGAG